MCWQSPQYLDEHFTTMSIQKNSVPIKVHFGSKRVQSSHVNLHTWHTVCIDPCNDINKLVHACNFREVHVKGDNLIGQLSTNYVQELSRFQEHRDYFFLTAVTVSSILF